MLNIILLCSSGMSTSLLVNKMREAAIEMEMECRINAYPVSDAADKGKDADIILLGPQIRFGKKRVEEDCPGVPVICIDMKLYGTLDGRGVLEQTKRELLI